ncbi:MAG: hypothetical protein WCP35_04420 [Verrucomicrobiota bacterium]
MKITSVLFPLLRATTLALGILPQCKAQASPQRKPLALGLPIL